MKVFCWLGWYDPSSVYGPTTASAPWPKVGFLAGAWPSARAAQGAVPREAAQAKQDAHPGEQSQLLDEVGQAGVALLGSRLVVRRGAADAGADVAIGQAQAVATAGGGRLVGEAGAVQGGEEPVAGAVAGEDAAGAVAAVRRRCQADDEERAAGSPKPGTGRPQ